MTLTPTTCEVELTVEGVAELTLEHPIDDLGRWEYLVNDNVIAAPTPYSKKQLFRIYDYTKTETEVTAYARHIFYDSAGEMLVDARPTDKTGQEALDIILSGTKYKAKTNIKTRSTAYYIRKNIMEAIGGDGENSFINRWGGERMYDNFTVIINDRLGGDYGACAEFGRNMTGIEADISIDDVVTRIIPVSYNGHTLEGEEPWIDSPLIGSYANPRAAVIKFEDVKLLEDCQEGEEGFSTLELLREELKRRCTKEYENGLDKPKVNYKVDLVEVANTEDYKDYKKLTTIGIGDDVLTKDRKLKINVTARCIRLVYDCMGSYVTQYYNNVLVAFNNSSKYVQISAGQIAIYNGEVTAKGKRAVFDQNGNSFYRDNYFVGRIGTNEWKNNSTHKGLSFDLEYQGKYMAWAQKESSGATSYDTILCYSRANSIYTEKGLHLGCNMYAHGWNLYNADLRNTSYDGYSSWTGEIPIITKIQANSDGTITWWSSSITVRNGGITSAPRS